MDERGQLLPANQAISLPLQALTTATGETEAAFASLEAVVAAGGTTLERVEGTLSRVAALLAGSGAELADGEGSLAVTLETASAAADRLLERLAALTTATERATAPEPWQALRSEIEATVENLERLPGLPSKNGLPPSSEANSQLSLSAEREGAAGQPPDLLTTLAPVLGSDFAARAAAAETAQAEAAFTGVPPAPLLYGAPHAQAPSTVTVAQGGPAVPAYAMPSIAVTLETPPLATEFWYGLFRTPGFEEALRQFLAEWAYHQSQQASPGPGY